MGESVYQLEAPPASPAASPEVTEGVRVGSAFEHDTKHTAEGLGRLLQQFKEKQRIEDFLSAFLDQIQEIEDAAWTLYIERTLENADGALLDQLGGLVGEERRGRTDARYRRFIGVRILSNRSDGQIEQLYSILRQIFGGTFSGWIDEHDPAAMVLNLISPVTTDAPASEIDIVLKRAKGGAVSLHAIYSESVATDQFLFDSSVATLTNAGILDSSATPLAAADLLASVHVV